MNLVTLVNLKKTSIIYGVVLAGIAFLLQWLDYLHTVRVFATELYIVLIAIAFTCLGLWAGARLAPGSEKAVFVANKKALAALGVSDREFEVLQLLADGLSNREIGERLFVSVNTVKTHVTRLYEKLDVSRRTQAVHKAKGLRLIE